MYICRYMYVTDVIDVVIPSFRMDEDILLRIVNVDKPAGFKLNFYIVDDNPGLEIPSSILALAKNGSIQLILNETNLGFSETRNKGIALGTGKWLLLLDDDVVPDKTLLTAYADAIAKDTDALGFAGVTTFPEPYDMATLALDINGNTGHSKGAKTQKELMWIPTTNIMLNRDKMDPSLFSEVLKKGGEDIEFLVRNALLNDQKYISVRDAVVEHPWWDGGHTRRLLRYGAGAAQIAPLPSIRSFTYHDFTNTIETLLLLLICSPFIIINYSLSGLFAILSVVVLAEFITNFIRSVYLSGKYSLSLAFYLFWLKNCYEAGYLYESLSKGRLSGFAERIDMSFSKKNPSWFRLNKWKIIKTCLIVIGSLLITSI
ncbi:glycosyltransferase [Pedobacter nyackensis]|uniref:glycosyltransferase n=1 Tax=Pedobacter nyackensis TaxID=475255 RepID=UPI002931925B|nr:glycosyltransferase [Pedobacter nyackensis]